MLLAAYNIFTARNPDAKLDLVLIGSLEHYVNSLKNDVEKMRLANQVHFVRTEKKRELDALWQECMFAVFPSLEETCGIFLLKAMYFRKPILCSSIEPFSKFAADAALYFDPKNPESIVRSLEKITTDEILRSDLVKRGQERFDELIQDRRHRYRGNSYISLSDGLKNMMGSVTGIYGDRWTGPEIFVFFDSGPRKRHIEFHFDAPSHLLAANLEIHLKIKNQPVKEQTLARGSDILVRQVLPRSSGYLTVFISPVFRPSAIAAGSVDDRFIGCLCHGCWIVTAEQERITIFYPDDS